MKGYDFDGESATDAIYNNEWATQRYSYGETGAIYDIDFGCFYGGYCETDGPKFWTSATRSPSQSIWVRMRNGHRLPTGRSRMCGIPLSVAASLTSTPSI